MKVSIIIPAYNEAEHIRKTLQAALVQDYPSFEVIVVDNNCTDETAQIAMSLGIVVIKESHKGTQWAREAGRLVAQGEVLAYLDADCLAPANWLSKVMIHFNNEKVVAVGGPYDYYDAKSYFRITSLLIQKYFYRYINFIFQSFKKGGVLIGGNMCIRADALMSIGGFDTSFVFYGDDTDTAKRLTKAGEIVFDKDIVVHTSARRFKKQGIIKITVLYIYHFFKVSFKQRSK